MFLEAVHERTCRSCAYSITQTPPIPVALSPALKCPLSPVSFCTPRIAVTRLLLASSISAHVALSCTCAALPHTLVHSCVSSSQTHLNLALCASIIHTPQTLLPSTPLVALNKPASQNILKHFKNVTRPHYFVGSCLEENLLRGPTFLYNGVPLALLMRIWSAIGNDPLKKESHVHIVLREKRFLCTFHMLPYIPTPAQGV